MIVILDTVRSAHNVGSIFRTADAAGVEKVYLCGYTPRPVDRFGRVQPEITKTSLGASEMIPWDGIGSVDPAEVAQAADETVGLIRRLQADGYTVVAIEQTPDSLPYQTWQAPEKVAFVFGNEVNGVSQPVLKAVDATLEISMHGQKESLNVSVSAGVILCHFANA